MITFTTETVQTVKDNIHLVEEHWEEIVLDKEKRPLDPWWEWFEKVEQDGTLITFVARDENEVLGYAVFILHPHLHSRNLRIAVNDAVFLRKSNRAMGAGRQFLKYCDEELEKMGVQMINWHVKPIRDFGPALESMGYVMHEKIYIRYAGD
jgi:L-amino acid N-acyltransferase YncA